MKKRYVISLIIVALLLIVTGVSYAYFSATVNNNGTTSTVTTGTMAIEFIDGSTVSLENAIPGSTVTKTFKVKNTGDIATTYNISLTDLTNTFADKTDLVYTLTLNSNVVSSTQIPSTSGYLATNQTIGVGVTQEYTLIITFKESTDSQDDNQNKMFKGTVSVTSDKAIAYQDATGASSPELVQGMIPVVYDASGNVRVADINTEWYSYTDHNWANAVLVNCADTTIKDKYFNSDMSLKPSVVGTTMSMDGILQMYVWIPRYKYLLWNAENGSSDPQAITIVFEDKTTAKSTGSINGTYLTHPAFTFGDTELNGIWVGKFETSGTTTSLTIKPNITSLRNITLGDMFNATRNQELTYSANYGIDSASIDTHMMKNMEWGAAAYLSSSIYGRYNDASTCISSGCEIWINNTIATGCSGASASAEGLYQTSSNINQENNSKMYFLLICIGCDEKPLEVCPDGYDWTTLGVNASTTGNIYGIYDMSGGSWEYVMGNMVDSSGNFYPSNSELTQPDTKYYDSYAYGTDIQDHARGKLGDATKETLKAFGNTSGGWNGDYAGFPDNSTISWFVRGGTYRDGSYAGVFHFDRGDGDVYSDGSFRSSLVSAQ